MIMMLTSATSGQTQKQRCHNSTENDPFPQHGFFAPFLMRMFASASRVSFHLIMNPVDRFGKRQRYTAEASHKLLGCGLLFKRQNLGVTAMEIHFGIHDIPSPICTDRGIRQEILAHGLKDFFLDLSMTEQSAMTATSGFNPLIRQYQAVHQA
nr:hypothetical protein [Polycladomyces sp. WAk]